MGDRAYLRLGTFDMNMPTLYGEGERAFKTRPIRVTIGHQGFPSRNMTCVPYHAFDPHVSTEDIDGRDKPTGQAGEGHK